MNTLPLPDLHSGRIGSWQPLDAALDLFRGGWSPSGSFFRLDLIFEGVVNPPGTIGCCGSPFDPFLFGPRPLFGYVELDMDADLNTGGDLDFPNLFYLGNVARFGGLPAHPRFANRTAGDHRAFDGDITTPPFVDRSGEEFHVAFHGWEITSVERSDDSNWRFEAGETWVVVGTLFHRAAGYDRFSNACCSGAPGSYHPVVRIQFGHAEETNRTVVSLVYPLTNAGAAATGPGPTEAADNIVDNQNSVYEALNELVISAQAASDTDRNVPEFALIEAWQFKNAADYLDPQAWELTALLGGSYRDANTGDFMLAWSDVFPNVLPADFNGDGAVTPADAAALDHFIDVHDAAPGFDADQTLDGVVTLTNFIPNFSVFDVNYDGRIDASDRPTFIDFDPYDADGDGDVDLRDFAALQRCFASPAPATLTQVCSRFDGDADGVLAAEDVHRFLTAMTGPE